MSRQSEYAKRQYKVARQGYIDSFPQEYRDLSWRTLHQFCDIGYRDYVVTRGSTPQSRPSTVEELVRDLKAGLHYRTYNIGAVCIDELNAWLKAYEATMLETVTDRQGEALNYVVTALRVNAVSGKFDVSLYGPFATSELARYWLNNLSGKDQSYQWTIERIL